MRRSCSTGERYPGLVNSDRYPAGTYDEVHALETNIGHRK